jgi:dihydrofolate reductase
VDVVEEAARLKERWRRLGVGGPLASALIRARLVDEYRLFISPVALGGGTPFFPPLGERMDLELVETRTFTGSGVEFLRYRV